MTDLNWISTVGRAQHSEPPASRMLTRHVAFPHRLLMCGNRLLFAFRDGESPSTSKCFPLLIGGSSDPKGLSTTVSRQCCSNLRCHNCDFSVEVRTMSSKFNVVVVVVIGQEDQKSNFPQQIFDNFRWSPDIDYLFLRNNMPDFSKLQSRLLARRNSRAYACQCHWVNAQEMTDLTGELKRLWHCGGKHG